MLLEFFASIIIMGGADPSDVNRRLAPLGCHYELLSSYKTVTCPKLGITVSMAHSGQAIVSLGETRFVGSLAGKREHEREAATLGCKFTRYHLVCDRLSLDLTSDDKLTLRARNNDSDKIVTVVSTRAAMMKVEVQELMDKEEAGAK